MVWAGPTFNLTHGRWHRVLECSSLDAPNSQRASERLRAEQRPMPRDAAEARGYVECPYCCPLPPCCASGSHAPRVTPVPVWAQDVLRDMEDAQGDD